tara:strand:- start:302 stop:457 length:156 start_codon:yes stop_codon:yes gene_type:complete
MKNKDEEGFYNKERCVCGFGIPHGYGYYMRGWKVKCFMCGRVNQLMLEVEK